MQENTNKAIAINSAILYVKMAISAICALLTTRFALKALGVDDFGLFSVLGGIITFIAIFDTIMYSTSNRFIAVAIGKGSIHEANVQFNVNLAIQFGITVLTSIIAYPLGLWYIENFINYSGDITSAVMVFVISVTASISTFVGVPYYGLLMAKERFIVFSLVDIFSHVVRLIVAYLLVDYFSNKLFIYTLTLGLMTLLPTVVNIIYCRLNFSEYCKIRIVKDKCKYLEVFSFSGWVAYGAVACIAKSQGAALLVNAFFTTAMNTALGIANSINAYVTMFATNVTQPMAPQITKSYSNGNKERTNELLIMSTKYSFMLMLLVGSPFIVSSEWLLELWLGEVPEFAVSFTLLLVIDNIVSSFNSGISNLIFASGKIKLYQILVNTLRMLSIVAGYFVLQFGCPAEYLFITYILFSFIVVITTQWILHVTLNYNNFLLIKNSYFPCILIIVFYLPILFLKGIFHPFLLMFISTLYLILLDFFVGFSREEQKRVFMFFKTKFR